MRQRIVSVVAGGWSVSQVPQHLIPGYVIAVNGSAWELEKKPDEIVSMDRLWAEHNINGLLLAQINTYLRRSTIKEVLEHKVKRPWFHLFENDNESAVMADDEFYPGALSAAGRRVVMTERPYVLNGTNSGMCAINRAYKLKPVELYLFGFDMQFGPKGERHWHADYPWAYASKPKTLSKWSRQFKGIAKQFEAIGCKVYNVNNRSLINAFPKVWLPELEAMKAAA